MPKVALLIVVMAVSVHSAGVAAQERIPSIQLDVESTVGPEPHIERIGREVERALAMESEDHASGLLAQAAEEARSLVAAYPDHADAHFLLAASLGSLMDFQGVRPKIRSANEVRRAAETALELDPDHAGAHHVLGRLHAGGMRASRIVRAFARTFLGAEVFKDISWGKAEEHFARAMALEPESPRHAMELGALYIDTDRPQEAVRVLQHAVAASGTAPGDSLAVERARLLLLDIPEEAPERR